MTNHSSRVYLRANMRIFLLNRLGLTSCLSYGYLVHYSRLTTFCIQPGLKKYYIKGLPCEGMLLLIDP
jgi:hypothetical protein